MDDVLDIGDTDRHGNQHPDHKEYEKRWIGDKPKIEHIKQATRFEDSDNMPDDPEQAGWDKLHEGEPF